MVICLSGQQVWYTDCRGYKVTYPPPQFDVLNRSVNERKFVCKILVLNERLETTRSKIQFRLIRSGKITEKNKTAGAGIRNIPDDLIKTLSFN